MSTSRTRYGLAIASAATLASLSCGALVGAAAADPGGNAHQGDKGKHLGQVKHEDKPDKGPKGDKGPKPDKPDNPNKGKGNNNGQANGHDHAPGQSKDKGPKGPKGSQGPKGNNGNNSNGNGNSGNAGEHGDPPGNNGTVKIAAPGDAVGHPSNNPHPGCTVVVEWFGFDAGDDVVSTVTFSPQAPTKDITIGGTSPSSVFVGGDAASGGTDLDGRQAYTLTFTGEPHPKQGYHVKLVVATPHSLGNDTKSKVFWVEPCEPTTSSEQPEGESEDQGVSPSTTSSDEDTEQGVLGTSAEVQPEAAGVAGTAEDADAAVPTSVDAGEDGSVVPDWARSPLPLVLVAGGLTLAGVAIARRSRAGA